MTDKKENKDERESQMKKIFQMKEPSQTEESLQDGKELHIRKNDWILIVILFMAAVGVYVAMQHYQNVSTNNAVAVVTVDGVEYGRYPLSEDYTETIRFEDGSYNRFAIQDGYVNMPEASCPDQICVHHSRISRNKETIVCLPDKVVIIIENGEDSGIDVLQH